MKTTESTTSIIPGVPTSTEPTEPTEPTQDTYVLRLGNFTPIPLFLLASIIMCTLMSLLLHQKGEEWFMEFYYPILGYYVVCIISATHYFPRRLTPNVVGFIIIPISVGVAIGVFYLQKALFEHAVGIGSGLLIRSHFLFIMLSFFAHGFDDTFFKGILSQWIPIKSLRSGFWYLVTWIVWLLLERMGVVKNDDWANIFFAVFQWFIMCELAAGLIWGKFLDKKGYSPLHRGFVCVAVSITVSSMVAVSLLLINAIAFGNPEFAENAHHVLGQGTYPLHAIILTGLYVVPPKDVATSARCVKRSVVAFLYSMALYFFYHLFIAPTDLMGDHPWIHHHDVIFNFSIAIIYLQHNSHCGRLGFVRKVVMVSPIEDKYQVF
jgi:hypothetical protein